MNEFEARRILLAAPTQRSAELEAAITAAPRLQALRAELLTGDEHLHEELMQIAVPAGLADRLIVRARFTRRASWAWPIAATFAALAVAALLGVHHGPSLASQMTAHALEAREEVADVRGVPSHVADVSLAPFGLRWRGAATHIRHLAECVVAGREGRHLIVDTAQGPVSLVILPAGGDEAIGVKGAVRLGSLLIVAVPHGHRADGAGLARLVHGLLEVSRPV